MATIATPQQPVTHVQRRIKLHTIWTVLIGVFWVCIVIGIIGGFFLHWNWTGFPQNGKLWDWLQLLSAPVFVSALPIIFRGQRNQADSGMTEQQAQADLKGEDDRQSGAALESYQDHILQLLLDRNLRGSQPGSDVREAARARTLMVLRWIGKSHKGNVLLFLYDAGLIYKGKAIVELHGADLSGADLSNTNLSGSDLGGVNFSGADLSNARLSYANLSGADLSGANLNGTDLSNAILTGANLTGAIYNREYLSRSEPYNRGSRP